MIVAILICCSCQQNSRHDIHRIVLATGDCYGRCPLQVVDIDDVGNMRYYGGQYADSSGYFRGKVTRRFLDSLNQQLESIGFRQLDSSYEHSVDDQSTEIFIFYGKDQVKHIRGQSASLPNAYGQVFYKLLHQSLTFPLIRTQDTFEFPTTVQHGPPPPTRDTIRFVPPRQ